MALFIKDVNRIYNLSNKAVSLKCRKGERLFFTETKNKRPPPKGKIKK